MDPVDLSQFPPVTTAGGTPTYDDLIEAGVLTRLRAVGVDPEVTTWRHLVGWVHSLEHVKDLLRVLRVTRDVKAFRGAFEELIVPLVCGKVTPGELVDCRAAELPPLGKRLAAQGVLSLADVTTWTDVLELLKVGKVPEMTVAGVPGHDPTSMEWQQLTALFGAVTNETEARPSRMLHGCVALGVELQDLGSAAVQCLSPALNILLAKHATPVQTRGCGTNDNWKLITDGANLEYVLVHTALLSDLVAAFAEIDALHTWLKKAPPGVYLIGDEVIVICEKGTTGRSMVTDHIQPQFNFELPLDLLCDFVAGLTEQHARYKDCFGAGGYFWKPSRTDTEIAECQRLATKVRALRMDALARVLGPKADEGSIRQVRGLMLLFGMCAIHAEYAKADEPAKDMPILCKTNPVRLTHELLLAEVLAAPARDRLACDAMFAALNDVLTPAGRRAMKDVRDRFAAGTHPVQCRTDVTPQVCVGGPRWASARPRRQVLLEVRRAPYGSLADCLAACLRILDHCVVDPQHLHS